MHILRRFWCEYSGRVVVIARVLCATLSPTVLVLAYMLYTHDFKDKIVWLDIGMQSHEVEFTTLWRSKIANKLDSAGYKVYFTQDMPDVDTAYRFERLRGKKGMLLMLGINYNSASSGCHVFVKPMQSKRNNQDTLALLLANHLMEKLIPIIEVKSGTKAKTIDTLFFNYQPMSGVLLEVGTLSKNPEIKSEQFAEDLAEKVLTAFNAYHKALYVIDEIQNRRKK